MNVWIGIVGTVIGVILGGMIAWLNSRFQLRYQEDRDRKRLVLGKLEEIHALLSQYKDSYRQSIAGHLLNAVALEPFDIRNSIPVPKERLRMLVGFYTPDLKEHLKRIECIGDECGKLIGEYILHSKGDLSEKKKRLEILMKQQKELENACDTIQREIILLSKKYI